MSQKLKYRLSVSMLDAYDHYLEFGAGELAFNDPDLIAYINHGKEYRTAKEKFLVEIKDLFKVDVFTANYQFQIVAEAGRRMAGLGSGNVVCSAFFNDVEIVGVCDFVGFSKGFVFVATNYYEMGLFVNENTNWFLRSDGVKEIEYVVLIAGKEAEGERQPDSVTFESYRLDNYDFGTLENKLSGLINFIEANRELITNKNIFVNDPGAVITNTPADG